MPCHPSLTPRTLPLSSSSQPLYLLSSLGQGAYGTIYLARHHRTGYAVKYLSSADLSPSQRRLQKMEAKLHVRCHSHPNVVTVYAVETDPQQKDGWYLVLEYCPDGDLFDYICQGRFKESVKKRRMNAEQMVKEIFFQILDAVEWCHSKGVYHRDLKPENFLVKENKEDGSVQVRLTDFGLATEEKWSHDRGCGSGFYMSPECQEIPVLPPSKNCSDVSSSSSNSSLSAANPGPYNTAACDIWSLGILLVNLTCQQNPWHRADATRDPAFRFYLENPSTALQDLLPITDNFAALLRRMLHPDPNRRATIPEIRQLLKRCRYFCRASAEEALSDKVQITLPSEDDDCTDLHSGDGVNSMPNTPAAVEVSQNQNDKTGKTTDSNQTFYWMLDVK